MIRPATPRDAPAVTHLWNAIIRDTLATFTTDLKSVDSVAAQINRRPFWVSDADGVQGFVTFGAFRSGPGYAATIEHTVILAADAQGRGIGRALMQTAMQAAHEQGHHIMIAAISSANPDAVAFHSALGFEQTAHMPQVGRKADQWLDLILMQKTLSAS